MNACDLHPSFVVRDPEDDRVIGTLTATSPDALDDAIARGCDTLRHPRASAYERSELLAAVARYVASDLEGFADTIATEGVKTIREARREAQRCVTTLQLCAEEAKRIGGETLNFDQATSGAGRIGWHTLVPSGLVAAITPFNDPLNLVAHKVGPALALGAPIILKPHPQTPYSALKLHRAFLDAGMPHGMFQIVLGDAGIGERLVSDPRPRTVSFTGGRAAGERIAQLAGVKKLVLELGGVGVVAVARDADVEAAADAIHSGAFWAAGQNCVHAQRIIVERPIADALRDALLARAERVRLGPKKHVETDMGPCVDRHARTRVLAYIEAARARGGRVLTGGAEAGASITPTWIEGLAASDPLLGTEVFGPVSTIEVVDDFAQIIDRLRLAGDAINVGVFTRDIAQAMAVYRSANAGAVIVNDSTDFRIDAMPFGGSGTAGLGREGARYAIEEYGDKKLMVLSGL